MPEAVLQRAASEMLDWHGSGMSVMEMSHRGKEFGAICNQAEADIRQLLAVPENFHILFMQGGGLGQNAITPLNMLGRKPQPATIDFVHTGSWSGKSLKEARRYANVNVAASGEASRFTTVPPQETWKLSTDAAYLHLCTNETIDGVEIGYVPTVQGDTPLVVDMSSHILSRQIDVSKYGVIFAGAQKNIGPAGLTLVFVRDDLLGHALEICRGIEVGHIFQLRTKYSSAMNLTVLDQTGQARLMEMGCYGIGVSRIVAAAIEQNHDERGIVFPPAMAPFDLCIVPIGLSKSGRVRQTAEQLHRDLSQIGLEVLLDDRDERPGIMFADMELVGIPHRLVVGERGLKDGNVEYRGRRDDKATVIPLTEAAAFIREKTEVR